jgi:Ca2+-binding EF-hand superfamily protein
MRKNFAEYLAAATLAAAPLAAQDAGDLFRKLDANKDGFVTPDEVQDGQKALYERLLRTSDKDGDKKLSQAEFQAGLKPEEGPRPPLAGGQSPGPRGDKGNKGGDAREFFSRLDANKDGKLARDEMPERMRENFSRLDANGDGAVSQEEFAQGARPFGKAPPGSPPAPAGNFDRRRAEETYDRGDANKDGKWTRDESPEGPARERFDRLVQQLNPGADFITKEQYLRGASEGAQSPEAPPPGRPTGGPPTNRADFEALFDRTDANSDGKLTKTEIPEERQGMRAILERSGGDSIDKEQFVRGMLAMMQQFGGQPPRPEGAPRPEAGRPDSPRPEGSPPRRPDGPPGGPPPGGAIFGALDADRNGELSTAEIVAAGTNLLKLDRNNDGKLTRDEVFTGGPPGGMPGRRGGDAPGTPPGRNRPGQRGFGGQNPEELMQRLKAADANNDGKLSKDEAPDFIKERFDRIDNNSDGVIDEAEMRQMARFMSQQDGSKKGRRPDNQ